MKQNVVVKLAAAVCMFMAFTAITPKKADAKWFKQDQYWRYSENGINITGWKFLNNKWYYFYSDGRMATNSWIDDGYYVNNKGALTDTAKYKRSNIMTDYIATGVSGQKYGQAGDEQNGILWDNVHNEPCLNCMYTDKDGNEIPVDIGLTTLNIYNSDGNIVDKALLKN